MRRRGPRELSIIDNLVVRAQLRGDILTLHPFGKRLETFTMSGAQVLEALEEQWPRDPQALPRVLKTSGLLYEWDPKRPAGHHVLDACDAAGKPIVPSTVRRRPIRAGLLE